MLCGCLLMRWDKRLFVWWCEEKKILCARYLREIFFWMHFPNSPYVIRRRKYDKIQVMRLRVSHQNLFLACFSPKSRTKSSHRPVDDDSGNTTPIEHFRSHQSTHIRMQGSSTSHMRWNTVQSDRCGQENEENTSRIGAPWQRASNLSAMQPFVVAKIIGRCQQIRCQTFLSLMFASRINVGTRNVVIVENLGLFFLFCDERPSRVRYVIGSAISPYLNHRGLSSCRPIIILFMSVSVLFPSTPTAIFPAGFFFTLSTLHVY